MAKKTHKASGYQLRAQNMLAAAGAKTGAREKLLVLLEEAKRVDRFGVLSAAPALREAARLDRLDCIEVLLAAGLDVNASEGCWGTAAMAACREANPRALERLIAAGASLRMKDQMSSPLLSAVGAASGGALGPKPGESSLRARCVSLLIAAGANVDEADHRGVSAVAIAASSGHLECLRALADAGARLDAPTKEGATPAMLAISRGQLACLEFLVERTDALSSKDDRGRSLMDWARGRPGEASGLAVAAIERALLASEAEPAMGISRAGPRL